MGKQTRENQQPRQQPAKKPEAPPAPTPPQASLKPKRAQDERRLPDGAAFTVSYCEATKRWTGKLAIGPAVFDGSATGVFRLLMNLDAAYRRSINTAAAPEPVPAHQAAAGDGR